MLVLPLNLIPSRDHRERYFRDTINLTTYFITFACYGSHLHGDPDGSVDRHHNIPGNRLVEPDAKRLAASRVRMDQPPYRMDKCRRQTVLGALVERCARSDWQLLAVHVRTNHVHIVVDAPEEPELVMNHLKSFASRRLNNSGFDGSNRKRWARHGSTRWLWNRESVLAAIQYVVDGQGEPMEVYEAS